MSVGTYAEHYRHHNFLNVSIHGVAFHGRPNYLLLLYVNGPLPQSFIVFLLQTLIIEHELTII
jgi:hypothetical protein